MSQVRKLSRREKEVLEVLLKIGEASAKDIQAAMANSPGNSSVRTHLRNLVNKGFAQMKEQDFKYVYFPSEDIQDVSRSALEDVVETFFKGNPALAVNQLLTGNLQEISDKDLEELEALIRTHRTKN